MEGYYYAVYIQACKRRKIQLEKEKKEQNKQKEQNVLSYQTSASDTSSPSTPINSLAKSLLSSVYHNPIYEVY
jgi:hypothetical protein